MAEPLAIGVDIGGTKLAFVLINRQGESLATYQLPTQVSDGTPAVMDRIAQGITTLLDQAHAPVAGIGMGVPGHTNPVEGIVHNAVNLAWRDVPLRDEVARRLSNGLPIWIQKDVNALAVGEMVYGAAQGCSDFVYVAVGTGLGGGAVANGQLVIGANYNPTEIGHLSLNPDGRQCACGLRGCPEMYISGIGLLAGVQEHRAHYPQSALARLEHPSTTDIIQAARAGDPLAVTVFADAARWLGAIMGMCAGVLNPAMFVIGGGLGHAASDLLLNGARRELQRHTLSATYERLEIVMSQIASSAVGAACLVWQRA
ncbi:MAG: ROK family protein [Anaerolineae bacterium]|nr:ROK family protein [Anaerolineae bacterium]